MAIVVAALLHFTAVPYIRRRINAMSEAAPLLGSATIAPDLNTTYSTLGGLTINDDPSVPVVSVGGGYTQMADLAGAAPVKPPKSGVRAFFDAQMAIIFDDEMHSDVMRSDHVKDMHAAAEVFDPKTEELFGFLQVVTATFMSFAHGANDVSNAIAPFAAIYSTYSTGLVDDTAPVPIWILAMGGFGIVMGLMFYGYRVRYFAAMLGVAEPAAVGARAEVG